ncbi:hypothetical protein BCV72DRAFT_13968 [Rhizopus microsporus var. microsporus]|uniref:Uncharacterized protein n=1 Tax=Rhizopus microsporus var. microsporus TaxID=86635 RepID=A0A1X0QXG5_RHIZD|nr:hypothetical protein BCV72DRAFT_13968 [Rhizopus microsporus var. microsporus]
MCLDGQFNVLGPLLTSYLMKLKAGGLYVMQELSTARVPLCIDDIPSYLTNLSKIKNIIHHFLRLCTQAEPSTVIILGKLKRDSPTTAKFDHVIKQAVDCKRQNYIKY